MLGVTVETVSKRLGIEPPDNWRDPVKEPSVEDLARWLERVPPTFDLHDPKGQRPPEIYDARGVQRNPLTGAELAELAQEIGSYFTGNTTAASLYLLLLYALSNEHDEADRSAADIEACESLSLSIDGIQEAFEADHVRRLAEWRKGDE
jgi:hypothetical protein